jgi:hypothetical protein
MSMSDGSPFPPRTSEQRSALPPSTEAAILDAVRSLQYGSVEITVHDSRVVQIECKKKIRLQPAEPKDF